jgi:hypothetical protein
MKAFPDAVDGEFPKHLTTASLSSWEYNNSHRDCKTFSGDVVFIELSEHILSQLHHQRWLHETLSDEADRTVPID